MAAQMETAAQTETAAQIETVVQLLQQSSSILFITGAGLSADSGLPTYRGAGGLYNGTQTEENLPIEQLLSGTMFAARPELTWKYLLQVAQACEGAKPNRGHQVIAEMEAVWERLWVLTQNVDGFHREAGSRNLIEIHGNLHGLHCTACEYTMEVENYRPLSLPPRCPECQAVLRPRVVLFGEMLPPQACILYEQQMKQGFDLVFSIGTSSIFPYIIQPVVEAYRRKKPVVEINLEETEVSRFATIRLRSGAAETLDRIWTLYQQRYIRE